MDKDHEFNERLYCALVGGDEEFVINLCQIVPDKALHILTPQNDTVLHIATYSTQEHLLRRLLEECLPEDSKGKILRQNLLGNTILHEAISNGRDSMARKMLNGAPELLDMRNKLGETAFFCAAACERLKLFHFLHDEIPEDRRSCLQIRDDKSTTLHITIIKKRFDLALYIAERNHHLIGKRDVNGMTALQLLSCSPTAFRRRKDGFLKRYISSGFRFNAIKLSWDYKEKQRYYAAASELARILIKSYESWEATNDVIDGTSPNTSHSMGQGGGEGKTPLFWATKSGCEEIAQIILKSFPLMVEYIDDNGQNILHLAIKYRRSRIFKLLTKMELPMRRLVLQVDKQGNNILHMAGIKMEHYVPGKMPGGPADQLDEEFGWFERVMKVTPDHFINHQNHMKQTAYELFATSNNELCNLAKEWLQRTAEGCSIVAVLIATVAFAAAYTIPGGPNPNNGLPLLLHRPFFLVFIVTDVLAITFALKAVLSFLSILTSPFRLVDFEPFLRRELNIGITCLVQSVAMMILAFAATISLMIHNEERWTKISLRTIVFLPIGMVARSHFYLYYSLLLIAFKYVHKKARCAFRWGDRVRVLFKNKWLASRRSLRTPSTAGFSI